MKKNLHWKLLFAAACAGYSVAAYGADPVRLGHVPFKAEVTGIAVNPEGELFFNAQHPGGAGQLDEGGPAAIIGYVAGVDLNTYDGPGIEVPTEAEPAEVGSIGEYVVLARTGDALGDGTRVGGVYTLSGDLMFLSNDVDYNAFVRLSDTDAYLYTAFEGASRKGVSTITRLRLEKRDGKWSADLDRSNTVDLSSIDGAWVLCFGSTSPWGSELLAEEYYFYNTALWNHPGNHDENEDQGFAGGTDVTYHMPKMMDRYLGRTSNPYRYGYIIEMSDTAAEQPRLARRYALGRLSHENAVVLGDARTVYMSDDDSAKYTDEKYNSNSGGVLFKFVADRPRDLSSGTLYAARAVQDSGTDPATTGFSLQWVELAHGDESTIARWIAEYEGITPDRYVEGQSSYLSEADIRNWAEGKTGTDLDGDGTVGSYPDDRPAFLESRKAAAALGATNEWNKLEGVAADGRHVYFAMSEIGLSMDRSWGNAAWDTGAKDEAATGDVALDPELCGGVYAAPIEADYSIGRLEPLLVGRSVAEGCDPAGIANPDNILAFPGGILIAEDAGPKMHPVDMLWLLRRE